MLNEAGEISIYRSRLEEHNSGIEAQLAEMAQAVARVREQLRQMDTETDAQIAARGLRSEEHTSELQSLMRISYAVFCLKIKKLTETTSSRSTAPNRYQNTLTTHK